MSKEREKKEPPGELFPVEETISPELKEARQREDDRLKKEKEDSKLEAAAHEEYTERLCNENPGLRERIDEEKNPPEYREPIAHEPKSETLEPSEQGLAREKELAEATPEALAEKHKADEPRVAFPGAKAEPPPKEPAINKARGE